jgi:hypothetical protein
LWKFSGGFGGAGPIAGPNTDGIYRRSEKNPIRFGCKGRAARSMSEN